jgi:dTDP-4-amino-4,6-dideoxygalactose transaminase
MTFDDACRLIVNDPKADAYAQSYAHRGIGMEGRMRQVQALYILANLSRWRHPQAKEVRALLKELGKPASL